MLRTDGVLLGKYDIIKKKRRSSGRIVIDVELNISENCTIFGLNQVEAEHVKRGEID